MIPAHGQARPGPITDAVAGVAALADPPRDTRSPIEAPSAPAIFASVLATDLDRTFSRPDLHLDEAALRAAAELRSRGVRLVLATGQVLGVLADGSPLHDLFDAYIMEGGGVWGRPGAWHFTAPDVQPIRDLTNALVANGVEVRRGLASLSIATEDAAVLHKVPQVHAVDMRKNRDRIDFTPKGVDKAVALRIVLQEWGIDPRHAVAVGDGENDAELLACVGHGVALANAVPGLKQVADEVAPYEAAAGWVWLANRIRPIP